MEETCIFCRIIRGEIPGEFVYEGETVVAFKDKNPQAPTHLLLVPRKHIRSLNDLEDEDRTVLSEMFFVAKQIAMDGGFARSGYKLVFNVERGGGQLVFHLHLHLLGGW